MLCLLSAKMATLRYWRSVIKKKLSPPIIITSINQVFYWTHLLYVPFWIILILHGSHFWIWFLLPGLIFLIEKGSSWFNKIKTFISSTELLPSKVIQLVIKKPVNFHFQPGDYVYVNVPSISSEWHPFTISSAPELPGDHFFF